MIYCSWLVFVAVLVASKRLNAESEFVPASLCRAPAPPINGHSYCTVLHNELICASICKHAAVGEEFDNAYLMALRCDLSTGRWSPSDTFADCPCLSCDTTPSSARLAKSFLAKPSTTKRSTARKSTTFRSSHINSSPSVSSVETSKSTSQKGKSSKSTRTPSFVNVSSPAFPSQTCFQSELPSTLPGTTQTQTLSHAQVTRTTPAFTTTNVPSSTSCYCHCK